MLKSCPECELPVSDQAYTCPHCGYPLKTFSQKSTPGNFKKRNHKRLPNGFGQITKLSNPNLRKPFRAMVTVGKTEEGRPIQKLLKPEAYFKAYNEAYEALLEYNKDPKARTTHLTLAELWDKWYDDFAEPHYTVNTLKNLRSKWKYFKQFEGMDITKLRPLDFRYTLDNANTTENGVVHEPPPSMKAHLKSMLNMLFDYATEYQYVERNYARDISLPESITKAINDSYTEHISFTDDEMKVMWSHTEIDYIRMMLVQCYTGFRPGELLALKLSDVNITDLYMTGGSKTESGKNRQVPIHSRIQELVLKEYNSSTAKSSVFLFSDGQGEGFKYHRYSEQMQKLCHQLGLNLDHKPHDCRKQFVTMAKRCNVNEYAIKRIVGHKIKDITEAVYTYRDINWLRSEIEKIDV